MNSIVGLKDTEPTPTRAVAQVSTPSDLLRMAVEQGADLDRLERLMALQERWEAGEARKAYVLAMTRFKAEPMEIRKNKEVGYKTKDGDFVGYKHAELSDITEVVGPAMARHGLSYRWDVRQEGAAVFVDCIVTHAHGHSEKVTMHAPPDASGKKNAIQQVASAVTYLQRYTLLSATGMSTKGMDDDGRGIDGKGEDEVPDTFRLQDWIAKAQEAATLDELADTKARGFAVIEKRKDAAAYKVFRDAVATRRKDLEGKAAEREPGQEGKRADH
jgi:hypothetical protein